MTTGWPTVIPRMVVDDPAACVAFLHTPYGDRRGMVKDPWGNVWQVATRQRR